MPEETLDNATRPGLLLKIHDRHRGRLDQRVSLGWKVSLALWSALGLILGAVTTGRIAVRGETGFLILALMVLSLIGIVYVLWIIELAKRNLHDQHIAEEYLTRVESRVKPCVREEAPSKCEKREGFWGKYHTQILQGVITVGLIVLVVWAYWARANKCRIPDSSRPRAQATTQRAGNISIVNKLDFSEK